MLGYVRQSTVSYNPDRLGNNRYTYLCRHRSDAGISDSSTQIPGMGRNIRCIACSQISYSSSYPMGIPRPCLLKTWCIRQGEQRASSSSTVVRFGYGLQPNLSDARLTSHATDRLQLAGRQKWKAWRRVLIDSYAQGYSYRSASPERTRAERNSGESERKCCRDPGDLKD